jgi:hypothetical protein
MWLGAKENHNVIMRGVRLRYGRQDIVHLGL